MKTTRLSMNLLRKAGCIVAVVEKWNPWVTVRDRTGKERKGVRQDLFGFADLIAITSTGKVSFIQLTDYSSVSKHRRKILENKNAIDLLSRGVGIALHGWKNIGTKGEKAKYECKIEEIKAPGSE